MKASFSSLSVILALAVVGCASLPVPADASEFRITHLSGGYEDYFGEFVQLNIGTSCGGGGGVEFHFTSEQHQDGMNSKMRPAQISSVPKGCTYGNWEISLYSEDTGYFYEQFPCYAWYSLGADTLELTCTTY
jgi:hypothetical protein